VTQQADRADAIKTLGELIKDIKFAMLTTVEDDGSLRSRPMGTQQAEFDGDLWFFTGASSAKVGEVQRDRQVNVSYADTDHQRYVSVSGTAQLVRDRAKIEELWNPIFKAWFPDGLDDPDLALLKVAVERAEYWDSPSSKVVQLYGFVKAVATGKRAGDEIGDNEKLSF
jgi:general stress protein 26